MIAHQRNVGPGGRLDATAMVVGSEGAIFVQNPTTRQQVMEVTLNATIGFDSGCGGASHLAVHVSGSSNRGFVAHHLEVQRCGSRLNITVPPTTALVLEVEPHIVHRADTVLSPEIPQPMLSRSSLVRVFGNGAANAAVDWADGTVRLMHTQGPAGEHAQLLVVIPMPMAMAMPNTNTTTRVELEATVALEQVLVENCPPVPVVTASSNDLTLAAADAHAICVDAGYADGRCAIATVPTVQHQHQHQHHQQYQYQQRQPVDKPTNGGLAQGLHVYIHLHLPRGVWSGSTFQNEIGNTSGFTGGQWSGTFSIPQAAMDQLSTRNKSYPIVAAPTNKSVKRRLFMSRSLLCSFFLTKRLIVGVGIRSEPRREQRCKRALCPFISLLTTLVMHTHMLHDTLTGADLGHAHLYMYVCVYRRCHG